jgi:hypothetical protein
VQAIVVDSVEAKDGGETMSELRGGDAGGKSCRRFV